MYRKLKWWIIITGIALLGIVVLQLYWVNDLYVENRKRFSDDMDNVMNSVAMRTLSSVTIATGDTANSLSDQLVDAVGKVIKDVSLSKNANNKENVCISMGNDINTLPDSVKVQLVYHHNTQVASSLPAGLKTPDQIRYEKLKRYTALIDTELQKRSLLIKHQLAIVDENGKILCCIDTNVFRQQPNKTFLYDLFYNNEVERFQLAYASPDYYILTRMLWILIVSGGLILVCSFSFVYLIVSVFRQKRLSEIKSDFINNMTHELKTPITTVSVALELLSDDDNSLLQNKNYKIANNQLNRLGSIVEKVLKVAAFENSDIDIHKEEINCREWLENILTQSEPILQQKMADLQVVIKPEDITLFADRAHMTNVMHNLLDNALKYNDKDRVEILLSISEDNVNTIIQITDNGIGIPTSYIGKVFDSFFRVPTGNIHNVKGYGLGLSYVRSIVGFHKGNISVDSTIGMGTTFKIYLPKTYKYA